MEDKLKEKQIEEMAKELIIAFGWKFGRPNEFNYIAEYLVEQRYQKLPKDSVVLSREELHKRDEDAYQVGITMGKKFGSKETAEKFIKECKKYRVKKFSPVGIDQRDTGVSWIEMPEWKFDELAKQFCVEIKGS